MISRPLLRLQRELAAEFKVSLTTIRIWLRCSNFPGGHDGPWNIEEIVAWRKTRPAPPPPKPLALPPDEGEMPIRQRYELARALCLEEQHRAKKIENDLREGNLWDSEEALQELRIHNLRIKERLEAIPEELEMEFPAEIRAEMKARLESKIRLILMEMAGWAKKPKEEADAAEQ